MSNYEMLQFLMGLVTSMFACFAILYFVTK